MLDLRIFESNKSRKSAPFDKNEDTLGMESLPSEMTRFARVRVNPTHPHLRETMKGDRGMVSVDRRKNNGEKREKFTKHDFAFL